MPHDAMSVVALIERLAAGLATYGAPLGFSTTEVTAVGTDATYARYVLTQQQRLRGAGQQWTVWKDILIDGGNGTTASVPVFPPAPATVPPAVAPGLVARLRATARRIKASPNYSAAIGSALGIEGAEETVPDLDTLRPELTLTVAGGQVRVGWTRGKADALELHVDRDGKGFVFLAIDSVPDYIDTEVLPATPAEWKYKAIYRKEDERIGQWSLVVSITVSGGLG
jgi:hypothetical protein